MNRTIRQARSLQTQFRAVAADGEKYIEGYFAVFGSNYELWPGASESIDPHAFDGALSDDIRGLIDHKTWLVLGRNKAGTLELKVDERGLWGQIKINQSDVDAMNLYARVERGDVDQCSFGFDILEEETEWRDDGSIHWTIKKVKLYEVSCVTFPAYEDTSIAARKNDYDQIKNRQIQVWRESMKVRLKKWH
ncbi:HK97 family phage prohead protease [Dehalobacterium formicoaceticum]|uniref:HK97 family phage prohead protease n=1 Tax=Dehalobacterium formicoaceticum TaxID=51515 RepID=UPI000B7FD30C|nr:HK97 family phage prohead protease [Dehalobacterium formicoaceticum]